MQNNRSKQRGQTIIELLIAILVVGIVVISVAVALTYSVQYTAEVRYREAAISLAQDAIEFFRSERARMGWANFTPNISSGTFCFPTIPTDLAQANATFKHTCGTTEYVVLPAGPFNPNFRRQIAVSDSGGGNPQISIIVTVSWVRSNGQTPSVVFRQNLRDWN